MRTKLAVQIAFAIAALVPVSAGLWGVLHPAGDPATSAFNHGRYIWGLLLGIGLAFWASIPAIETHTTRVRLLTAIVFVGGLCRLLGVLLGDPLSKSVAFGLGMELVVTPLLCLWHSRLADQR